MAATVIVDTERRRETSYGWRVLSLCSCNGTAGADPQQDAWLIVRRSSITQEFIALANHRKVVRAEIAQTAERLRRLQLDAV
jgi:hypothetical protein